MVRGKLYDETSVNVFRFDVSAPCLLHISLFLGLKDETNIKSGDTTGLIGASS